MTQDRTEEDSNKEEHPVPDGGWGWVVCLTSALTNGTIFSLLNTFGVLFVAIVNEHGADLDDANFKTSLIGSIYAGLLFFMSPFASILIDRFSLRLTALVGAILSTVALVASAFVTSLWHLYLTYGVLHGIGSSLVYAPSLVILGHYFRKHLGLVNGVVTLGSGVFSMGLPFLLKLFINKIGLRYTMLVLGGLMSLLIVYSLCWKETIKPHRAPEDYESAESLPCLKRVLNVDIWKKKGFRIWVFTVPMALFGYFVPCIHLITHVKKKYPDFDGEVLLICIASASAVSRLVVGRVSDLSCVSRLYLQQCAFVTLGVVTSLIPLASTFYELCAITVVMGVCDGCIICLLGPIAFDLVGPSGASQAIGFLLGLVALPATLGPPAAGLIFDRVGSYDLAFYLAGIPPLAGAIIMFFIPYRKQISKSVSDIEIEPSEEGEMELQVMTSCNGEVSHFRE